MSRKNDPYGDRTEVAGPEDAPQVSSPGVKLVTSGSHKIPTGTSNPKIPTGTSNPKIVTGNSSPSGITPPAQTWNDDPWDRTSHAREGALLSRLIETRAARWAPAQGPARRLMVQEPEERTGGGARARLAMSLVAKDKRIGALVIGWLDPAAMKIELRPYPWMFAHHQERFGHAWEVTEDEYRALAEDLVGFAQARGLDVGIAAPHAQAPAPGAPQPEPAAPAPMPQWVWVALGVLIGVGAAWVTLKL